MKQMEADLKWLEDPGVFQVNRLDAHSDHAFYETVAQMESGENPLIQNGDLPGAGGQATAPPDFMRKDLTTAAGAP